MVLSNGPSLCPVGLRYDQPSVVFSLIITAPKCQTGLRPWKNIWKGLVENWAGQLGCAWVHFPGCGLVLLLLGNPQSRDSTGRFWGSARSLGWDPAM